MELAKIVLKYIGDGMSEKSYILTFCNQNWIDNN